MDPAISTPTIMIAIGIDNLFCSDFVSVSIMEVYPVVKFFTNSATEYVLLETDPNVYNPESEVVVEGKK